VVNQQIHTSNTPPAFSPGVFYCFLFILISGLFSLAAAQPKLEVMENKKNFGSVKRGEIIKNVYEISNTGDQPLLITAADVACSCTSVDFPKDPLLPGKKTIITVSFNTTTVYGRQDRIVMLKSNDPRGDVKLRFKGSVSRD
jgi:hypothetical protein